MSETLKVCEVCGTSEGRVNGKTGKFGMNLCRKCFYQIKTHGNIIEGSNTCEVCGIDIIRTRIVRTKHGKSLCHKHSQQMYAFGEIHHRTIRDKNEIIIHDTYATMYLYNRRGEKIREVLIDISDIDILKQIKWNYDKKSGYSNSKINDKTVGMHKFIMNTPIGYVTDHINGNKLDNRRCNLRIVTQSQNSMNMKTNSKNTSGYKGIVWHSRDKIWEVSITVKYNVIYLGRFTDINDAIAARKAAEDKYFGEFAYKAVTA